MPPHWALLAAREPGNPRSSGCCRAVAASPAAGAIPGWREV